MYSLKNFIILLLIGISLTSVLYKNYYAKIDLVPKSSSDLWNVSISYPLNELQSEYNLDLPKKIPFDLPFISETPYQKIIEGSFANTKEIEVSRILDDSIITIDENHKGVSQVNALLTIELNEQRKILTLETPVNRRDLRELKRKYTSFKGMNPNTVEKLKLLNQKFINSNDSLREKARKIYYFITEEIALDENVGDIDEVLSLSVGSSLARAQLFTYLCRLNQIPTRINVAYQINAKSQIINLHKVYIPEILIGSSWILAEMDRSPFSDKRKDSFTLFKDFEAFPELFKSDFIKMSAASVLISKVDSVTYTNKLKSVSKIFSALSLHNLPVNLHSVFYTVLLIPLGTLILAFSKNIIGLKSFGIFTPILLSLFFLETSLLVGSIFFMFIVLLGFAQRYLLDRLYLLAIPRLSILLTLVIISYTFFSLVIYQNNSIFQLNTSINYLPIVIITGFIERFSVHFVEEGAINTFKALIGTVIIAILCYLLFTLTYLKQILFNNPELLLIVIALNLMIGSYKGYRLSEIMRFKEFEGLDENV